MPTVLIAMKDSDNFETDKATEQIGYSYHVINSVFDPLEFPADTCRALVDEDFDGAQTGWQLAFNIRQTKHPIKIIMVVREKPHVARCYLYDVTWGLPFSFETLKEDFERSRK